VRELPGYRIIEARTITAHPQNGCIYNLRVEVVVFDVVMRSISSKFPKLVADIRGLQ
jgi:hypothetical protein